MTRSKRIKRLLQKNKGENQRRIGNHYSVYQSSFKNNVVEAKQQQIGTSLKSWNYNTNRKKHVREFLYKSLLNSAWL